MTSFVKVLLAVAATELLLWASGFRSWANEYFQKWPWLGERHAVLFPLLLVVLLLVLCRWPLLRSRFWATALFGCYAGFSASLIAIILAQIATNPERANFLSGLRAEGGLVGFFWFAGTIITFRTLGWLNGALAFSLLAGMERLAIRLAQRHGDAGGHEMP